MPSRRTKSRNARSGTTRKRHNRTTYKRTRRSMCKRAMRTLVYCRTRGLHRAGGIARIDLGKAHVLNSSEGDSWTQQQHIYITPTSTNELLLGESFHIDKLRFYYSENHTLIQNRLMGISFDRIPAHEVPIKSHKPDWRYRVDFLDADNQVISIQFENDPNERLNGIMRGSHCPKKCIMQGMLNIKYSIINSATQPVMGGYGSWATANCVFYETQVGSSKFKFDYQCNYIFKSKIYSITLVHQAERVSAVVYPIANRNSKIKSFTQYRFDLYWDQNAHHLCLAAPDEDQKKAWIQALRQAGCSIRIVPDRHPQLASDDGAKTSSRFKHRDGDNL